MYVWKFKVTATRERFMEPPLHDTWEEYIAAYSYDQAHTHVWARLNKAGWTLDKIEAKEIILEDIRDSCDHTTD